jgi:hypothetical protein
MKIAIEYKQLHPRSMGTIKMAPKDAVAVAALAAEYNTPLPDSQPHYTAEGLVVEDTGKELFELQGQRVVDRQALKFAVIPTLLPGIEVR